ncbi:MAG: CvpA family protein [Defluviitaleaceae bacterium]|nr:CvpA family protein [Defluviitaleaceae bacterium]MCL2836889.1 CvpA family protein [Defluviitaleaceae bacterium]
MNILDLITTGIILICVIVCAAKGLLISLFNLFSLFISFLLARRLYPFVGELLRETSLFGALKQIMLGWLGPMTPATDQIVTDAVDSMALPELFKRHIIDNIDLSQSLDLTGVYDSVSGYAAGLAIDALAIVVVFAAVFLLMRIIAVFLRIVSRLPVVKTFNRLGGAIMGLVIGAILSWLTLSLMNGLFSANPDFPVPDMIAESLVARFFMFNL